MRMDMTLPEGSTEMTGEGVSSADGSRGRVVADYVVEGQHVPMTIIGIGDEAWMRSPKAFAGMLPRGKRWVHSVDPTTAPQTLTPSEWSRFLAEADGVSVVDEDEPVRGSPTTHYKGNVDAGELADEVGGETEQRIQRALAGRELRFPVEAWIGRDGLPVRLHIVARDASTSIDVTADMLEYGVPVNVKPPPPDVVVEESALPEP
jgi:hypothetical protein